MNKIIKFKNDCYLDSSSVMHNKTLLSELQEKVIWDSSSGVKISTTSGNVVSLNNMPNLEQYKNHKINFYINYNMDGKKIFRFLVSNKDDRYFISYVRDYDGDDVWNCLFVIYNIFSNTWNVKSSYSYQVRNGTIKSINLSNYTFKLYRVTVSR